MIVKEKLTQLRLPCEVIVEESKVQRSKVTGALKITMPMLEVIETSRSSTMTTKKAGRRPDAKAASQEKTRTRVPAPGW